MTTLAKRIYLFLDDQCGRYLNSNLIEFNLNIDNTIFVMHCINPPPEEYADFGLYYPHNTLDDFAREFEVTSVRQLKTITAEQFWILYNKGKAEVYCSIVAGVIFYAVYFRLTNNQTMIVRDDYNRQKELKTILTTPKQFIEYAQGFFWENEG
ncbi:hypothetical protein [Niastella sp. OAS944]|uniref:hypothetical protein n=1 Tax=Niastella sp. OAS944 TaxID=2664089 RepID=UPI00349A0877|nr:hypothetical protein [Chitinophagaceae bacterium OAS944]